MFTGLQTKRASNKNEGDDLKSFIPRFSTTEDEYHKTQGYYLFYN